jgi:membrane dipeptidase
LTLHRDSAVLCTTVAEADAAAAAEKIAVFVAVEGAALLGCTLTGLAEGYRRGVRLVTLCWNKDNRLCGAAFDSGSGLTEAGQEFVRACWKTGVAVDLSHASEQTFWDVLAIAQRPVICTHSNAKALCDHPRNLTDEQIRAIVANDGCVGLNFCTDFLGGNRDVEAIVDHAEHFLPLGAAKNLCLGTDFDGIEETPLGMAGVQDMPVLYDAMLRRGLSEATVQDIFYGNLRNYLQKAL